MSTPGLFLVLEGVEGVGKSTQARLLAEWLGSLHRPFRLSREPGGTPVGEAIRHLLLDAGTLEVPDATELLLMLAARAAFVSGVVEPALERGEVMISDRFELSTLAYQGYGRGIELGAIQRLNRFATGGRSPDLTLLFDLPVEEGIRRQEAGGKGKDRIEGEGRAFLERVREGYLELARSDPAVHVIDAIPPPDEVHQTVRTLLESRFSEPRQPSRG